MLCCFLRTIIYKNSSIKHSLKVMGLISTVSNARVTLGDLQDNADQSACVVLILSVSPPKALLSKHKPL